VRGFPGSYGSTDTKFTKFLLKIKNLDDELVVVGGRSNPPVRDRGGGSYGFNGRREASRSVFGEKKINTPVRRKTVSQPNPVGGEDRV